jgi:5-(carboxyamino)imidazole ribonucleotide mutase
MADVAVVMGSISDWDVMKAACDVLEEYGVSYEKRILSAHRTPLAMIDFAAKSKDIYQHKVIIAGAGGAAHLPGMFAAITTLPVIGVPIRTSTAEGLDSLLSIVQMPRGVPVATVAINNATNAAILACQILALTNSSLSDKIVDVRENRETEVKALNDTAWDNS